MSGNSNKPNILLILTDEHAPKVAGFSGDEHVRTQHLDDLAGRSVQFDNAFCASPVCTPSRMCLLTGKDDFRCAAWSNHWIIFPEHVTWPTHFAAHGYRTGLVGKMHFGGRDQMRGFQVRPYGDLRHGLSHQPEPIDLFPSYHSATSGGITEIPESLLQDVVVTRETIALLLEHQSREPETPWFVCASYSRPHSPFTAPGRYIRYYRDRLPPIDPPSGFAEKLEPFARRLWREFTPEETRRGREGYYACVDFADDCIGELLKGVGDAGLLENTVVIYTSDHGEMAGLHGLWGKGNYYDPSIGVPLLIRGPGIREGHHPVPHPISLIDLYPTTCGLAGLPIPEGLDGKDFSGLLADPEDAEAPREYVTAGYCHYGVRINYKQTAKQEAAAAMRVVRSRDWKYVDIEKGDRLLFDMVNDPEEEANLAESPHQATRCRKMREALFEGFSWEWVHQQMAADRARLSEFQSGQKPTTPNQYMLPDGRVFDAEGALYDARWLSVVPDATGGIIPQQFG